MTVELLFGARRAMPRTSVTSSNKTDWTKTSSLTSQFRLSRTLWKFWSLTSKKLYNIHILQPSPLEVWRTDDSGVKCILGCAKGDRLKKSSWKLYSGVDWKAGSLLWRQNKAVQPNLVLLHVWQPSTTILGINITWRNTSSSSFYISFFLSFADYREAPRQGPPAHLLLPISQGNLPDGARVQEVAHDSVWYATLEVCLPAARGVRTPCGIPGVAPSTHQVRNISLTLLTLSLSLSRAFEYHAKLFN